MMTPSLSSIAKKACGQWSCFASGTMAATRFAADERIMPCFALHRGRLVLQASPMLLNSLAVAKMHMGEYQEAEGNLVEVGGQTGGLEVWAELGSPPTLEPWGGVYSGDPYFVRCTLPRRTKKDPSHNQRGVDGQQVPYMGAAMKHGLELFALANAFCPAGATARRNIYRREAPYL